MRATIISDGENGREIENSKNEAFKCKSEKASVQAHVIRNTHSSHDTRTTIHCNNVNHTVNAFSNRSMSSCLSPVLSNFRAVSSICNSDNFNFFTSSLINEASAEQRQSQMTKPNHIVKQTRVIACPFLV